MNDKAFIFIIGHDSRHVFGKAIPEVFLKAVAGQPPVVGGVVAFEEPVQVVFTPVVQHLGDPGRVALDGKMLLDAADDRSRKKGVFDVYPVFPRGAAQYDGFMLAEQVVAYGAVIGKGAGNNMARASRQGHMQQFGAVGRGEHQSFAGNELAGIFEGGVAILQPFGYPAIPFSCGDAANGVADVNTFGDVVDGDHGVRSIEQRSGDSGSSPQHIYYDDHRVFYFVQFQQGRGKYGMQRGF